MMGTRYAVATAGEITRPFHLLMEEAIVRRDRMRSNGVTCWLVCHQDARWTRIEIQNAGNPTKQPRFSGFRWN